MHRLKKSSNPIVLKILSYILLIIVAFISIFPFYIIIANSLKTKHETAVNPIGLPVDFNFQNYVDMFVQSNYIVALRNNIIITVFSVLLSVLFGSLAAFAVARFRFKFSTLLYYFFIFGLLLPLNTMLLPLYLIFAKLCLINSIANIILLYTAFNLPMTVFVLTGFFQAIPKELEDSANIDGCSKLRVYFNIFLPLSKAPLSWVIILNSLNVWNDFMFPLFFLQSDGKKTLVVKMFFFSGQYKSDWNLIFAFITISVLPIIILFILLQKYFISGIMAGSLKG